jgi:hypothetical protein
MDYKGSTYEVINLGSGHPISLIDMVRIMELAPGKKRASAGKQSSRATCPGPITVASLYVKAAKVVVLVPILQIVQIVKSTKLRGISGLRMNPSSSPSVIHLVPGAVNPTLHENQIQEAAELETHFFQVSHALKSQPFMESHRRNVCRVDSSDHDVLSEDGRARYQRPYQLRTGAPAPPSQATSVGYCCCVRDCHKSIRSATVAGSSR